MRALPRLIFLPILFLSALLVLINLRDQKPDPGIETFVRGAAPPVTPQENAYFPLCAHRVPSGKDPHARGVSASKLMDEIYRESPIAASEHEGEGLLPPGLVLAGDMQFLAATPPADILARYRGREDAIRALLQQNRELVERYLSLYGFPRFRETIPIDVNALDADITSVKETHRLVLAGIALGLQTEGVAPALSALEKDVRFWRMVLGNARHLVNKMIAVGILGRDVRFLSGVARHYDFSPEEASLALSILEPLVSEEKSLRGTMGSQCAFSMLMITKTFVDAEDKRRAFFKEQATRNIIYRQYRDDLPLYALPAKDFHEKKEKSGARGARKNPFYYLYNPIGKLVHQVSLSDISRFQYKLHELDGFFSLVRLQVASRHRPVPPALLDAFFEDSCPPECNPFTLEPFTWDAGTSTLSFSVPPWGKSIMIGVPGPPL